MVMPLWITSVAGSIVDMLSILQALSPTETFATFTLGATDIHTHHRPSSIDPSELGSGSDGLKERKELVLTLMQMTMETIMGNLVCNHHQLFAREIIKLSPNPKDAQEAHRS